MTWGELVMARNDWYPGLLFANRFASISMMQLKIEVINIIQFIASFILFKILCIDSFPLELYKQLYGVSDKMQPFTLLASVSLKHLNYFHSLKMKSLAEKPHFADLFTVHNSCPD